MTLEAFVMLTQLPSRAAVITLLILILAAISGFFGYLYYQDQEAQAARKEFNSTEGYKMSPDAQRVHDEIIEKFSNDALPNAPATTPRPQQE